MINDEREAYRNFVRGVYRVVYHMPPYAIAEDYARLLQPVLDEATALLGEEEIVALQEAGPDEV